MSRKKPITISCSASPSPSSSAWTRTLVRSSVGFARRSSISALQRSKISGTSSSMIRLALSTCSRSPAPSELFISRAQISSSAGGMPMKLPITRETTGWATSVTRSQVSRSPRRSRTRVTISRIAGSCSAIRRGVNPRWNSCLSRSCLGGSMPMNIARVSSSGMIESVSAVTPPRSEEKVCQSWLTACRSSGLVTDQNPASWGNWEICEVQCTGHSERIRLNSSCGGPCSQCSRSPTSTSSSRVCSAVMRASSSAQGHRAPYPPLQRTVGRLPD